MDETHRYFTICLLEEDVLEVMVLLSVLVVAIKLGMYQIHNIRQGCMPRRLIKASDVSHA